MPNPSSTIAGNTVRHEHALRETRCEDSADANAPAKEDRDVMTYAPRSQTASSHGRHLRVGANG